MLSLCLIGIKNEGNLGAIARVMKNFGAEELILVDTKINPLSKTALDRASHAVGILKNARRADLSVFKNYDLIVGTTANIGGIYNIPRFPLTPRQIREQLRSHPKNKILLVLGREDCGLSNEELAKCDLLISIPASKTYPVMNVSHAAAVVLYELFGALSEQTSVSHITSASRKELEHALKLAYESTLTLSFLSDVKKRTQERLWKKIIFKSFLTKRETSALIGFFKKLLKQR